MTAAPGSTAPVAVGDRPVRRPMAGRLWVFAAILLSAWPLRIAVVSFTPLAQTVTAELHLSRIFIGVFGMLPALLFAVAGLLAPPLMARFGLECTVLIAMSATGIGMLTRAFAPDGYSLLVLSAVALAGMGIGNIVLPPLVKRYFPDRTALLSALYISLVLAGTIVPALIAVPLADASGWRGSLGLWSVFGFLAVVPWLVVLRTERVADPATVVAAPEPRAIGSVWRTPIGLGMATLFGATAFITYAMFTWTPTVLTDAGASRSFAGSMVGVFSMVGVLPALSASTVVAKLRNPFPVIVVCASGYLVGFSGLHWAPMAAPLLWVLACGLGMSTFPVTLVLINARSRTPAGSAALSGFTQGIGYVVGAAGPLLFGVLHSMTDGWTAPLAMVTLTAVAVMVGGWFACRPGYIEDAR